MARMKELAIVAETHGIPLDAPDALERAIAAYHFPCEFCSPETF